ncbi:MAG: hypothetical protein ACYDD0_01860 [Candidatus Dormibacteria bacterium]
MDADLQKAIAAIPEDVWAPLPYRSSAATLGTDKQAEPICGADVAEARDVTFGKNRRRVRIIVRQMGPTAGGQITLFTDVSYHPCDRPGWHNSGSGG